MSVFVFFLEFVWIKFFGIWLSFGIMMNCECWNYYFYFCWDVNIFNVMIFMVGVIYLKYRWVQLERFVYDVIKVIDVLGDIED